MDALLSIKLIFQYDATGELKLQQDSMGRVDLYTYDNQGRELTSTQQAAGGGESIITSSKYDKNGNKRFEVDGNGKVKENIYDALNRLTQTKVSVSGTTQATTFGFDA